MKENSVFGKRDSNRIIARASQSLFRANMKVARSLFGVLSTVARSRLKELTQEYRVSIGAGDVLLLAGVWYITHSGLLRIACRRRCAGIRAILVDHCCDPTVSRWVFRATVYTGVRSKGFVGYGDADPSNTSPLVRGAEMRVAETRAVNRALRKAYGIGLCSVEELGSQSSSIPPPSNGKTVCPPNRNGSANGQPRLRDKLCLLIRKYELNPNLVKRYAADFCGTQELRDAGRDLIEAFVSTLAEEAAKDRAALLCKLNSYSQPEEVKS
jgi:hypothetical protein